MKYIFLLLFCSVAASGLTQFVDPRLQLPQQNALLSRYGLGLIQPSQPAGIYVMGGAAAGFCDPYQVNPDNPASLGFLEHATFELGLSVRNSRQNTKNERFQNTSGLLRHLILALPTRNPYADQNNPIKHKSMFSTGLMLAPKTQVGYMVNATYPYPGNDTVRVNTNLLGYGGLNTLSWMNAYRYKQLALGAALDFNFGSIHKIRRNYYDFLPDAFNETAEDVFNMRNIVVRGGLMYDFNFSDKSAPDEPNLTRHLVVGIFGQGNQSLTINESSLYLRQYRGSFARTDTLRNTLNSPTRLIGTLPGHISIGVMYEQPFRFRLTGAYRRDFWSSYRNPAETIGFGDINLWQLGGEYMPDYNAYNNFWRRIRYRGGVTYGTDRYLGFDGQSSRQFSVRIGGGFPFKMPRRQVSFVNFNIEYGQLTGAVIDNRFVQATFGLQLNDDSWFFKRRYE